MSKFRQHLACSSLVAAIALAISACATSAFADPSDSEACLRPSTPDAQIAACTRLIEAGAANPSDLAAFYFHRAIARRFQKQYDAAIADFDAGLKLDPKAALGYIGRGTTRALMRQLGDAVKDFDTGLQLDPNNLEGHAYRGMAYAQQGQYDAALADFDEVVRRDPKSPGAYYQRGMVYRLMGKHEQASQDMATAVDLQPNNPLALNDLGLAYLNGLGVAKDKKKAIELFEKAAALGFEPAKQNLAHANAPGN